MSDFYWLGRAPCRTVQIVGIVVGVSQYEGRTVYIGKPPCVIASVGELTKWAVAT